MSISDEDGWHLIRPNPIGGLVPPELSTGNAEDDQLLLQIAARASLDQPRAWRHYVYVPNEASAQTLARPLVANGWDVDIFAPDKEVKAYCVIAEQEGVILTAGLVRDARELFEKVVAHLPGAEYDGWEVSIETDEYVQESL